MPSSVKALNKTEHLVSDISPRKRQTADKVMHTFSRFKNRRDVGRLTIVLAKYMYFSHDLMACSTTTGHKGTKALDTSRLQQLRANIHSIFPLLDEDSSNLGEMSRGITECLQAHAVLQERPMQSRKDCLERQTIVSMDFLYLLN